MAALPESRRVGAVILLCLALGALPIIGIISMMSIASAAPVLGIVLLLILMVTACCFLCYVMTRRPSDDQDLDEGDEPAARSIPDDAEEFQDPAVIGAAGNASLQPQAGVPGGRWQVQAGPGGGWVDFDDETSNMLDQQSASGNNVVRFSARGMTYEINMLEMVQSNVRTGKQRPIRNLSTT
eukprot:CAMPEP_0197627434 /NCGR_PEP_ID=MMETSP1338-20131121/6053_1 /TAXON_ID=43686 ORGANISM="Pelagodinium beii, Strain RCC1491" /NCGR_SAMPLE_ID=MMETSP1338 /ASSEMBLY_ACC=CAM_ASM_000754 /LENGTH=181 /DNA_ID=CAMNT_0043198161 /DNA_START=59 /DNA_END=604 /DNA_ORIENTATION=-